MKVSFITTVYNEEDSIGDFLSSLFSQTTMPDEIIIVDGGSSDRTIEKIKDFKQKIKNYKGNFVLLIKKGNRSLGRNTAIKHAKGEIIACSDAGCILDKNWLKNIVEPFDKKNIDVASGFYYPKTRNIFEKCLATYTCVMPDKIDQLNFLPSSRSVAFKKVVWEKVGGYPEELNTCEDLVFDKKLKRNGFHFYFSKEAFVYWPQRHTINEAFIQFYSYAKGDGEAFYVRPQTPLLFLRYLVGIFLAIIFIMTKSILMLSFLLFILVLYILWAVAKNYRYIKNIQALYILPFLQFTSDIAVLTGFSVGIYHRKKLL